MKNEYGETLDRNGYAPSLFKGGSCAICGSEGQLIRHEIFAGTRRANAKKYGAWLTLCPACHEAVHAHPLDYAEMKSLAQVGMRMKYGMTTEEFIAHFGKNYLEVENA